MTLNNDKIKPREFYAELRLLRQEQRDMEIRIVDKIDGIGDKYATKEDVTDLRKRIRNSDIFLGAAVVISGAIGSIFGNR